MTSSETTTHYRTCPLCEAACGLEVTTKDDAVLRIRGDRQDPVSQGFICPKGSTLKQLHEDADRLRGPVVRTADGWQPVSWDEAFAEIGRRLGPIVAEHGRQATGVVLGNPSVHNLGGALYARAVIRAARTTNLFSASTVDQMPKHLSSGLLWGDPGLFPLPDLDRTDYFLMLGANPHESNGSLVTIPDMPGRLAALRDRGGKFVVVDPRATKSAKAADEHLSIRPGTDAIWLLSLINVVFADGLVSLGRAADFVTGVDDVASAVAAFSPEVAEGVCGIPADSTRRIAHELAAARTAAVYGRIGTHTAPFGTVASWAADVLNVLTGNLDRPGGVMFNCAPTIRLGGRTPGGRGMQTGRWAGAVSGRPEVMGELPAATLANEIEGDGQNRIRALFLIACNPVRSFPNSDRLDRAMAGLDLLVAVDPYINASSRHAHIILPPLSALERSHYDVTFERNMLRSFAKYSPPVLEATGPDEPEILARLAQAVAGEDSTSSGVDVHRAMLREMVEREVATEASPIHGRPVEDILAALEPWAWAEQIIDLRLRVGRFGDGFGTDPSGLTLAKLRDEHPHGIDFGPLEERFPEAIKTQSGTIELLPDLVASDITRLSDSDLSVDGLVLIGRRNLRTCNTWMHNVDVLISGREQCTLQVHPDDAATLKLTDEGRALIRSRVGEVEAPVEFCADLMPGVVSLPFGWGYDSPGIEMQVARKRPGVNANALTDEAEMDAPSGNAVLNAIPVQVEPA